MIAVSNASGNASFSTTGTTCHHLAPRFSRPWRPENPKLCAADQIVTLAHMIVQPRAPSSWTAVGKAPNDGLLLANEHASVQIRRRDGDDQHHDENSCDNQAAVDQGADWNAWFAQWQ